MRKLMLALAVALLVSAPAFAAVQNVKVSGDVDSWWVNRNHFNLGFKPGSNNSFGVETGLVNQNNFITQTRVRVDADLSDNVATTVRLLSENTWGNGNISGNLGVDLAYATLREFLYSPLTVTVGRQNFIYGSGLVLGGNGPNNTTSGSLAAIDTDLSKNTSNDGVKLVFDYKPLTLDVIYLKAGQIDYTGNPQSNKRSSDVYGLNANYQLGDSHNSVVEGYFFSRVNGSGFTGNANANDNDTVYVPGLRVSTNPVKGLTASAEVAWQLGTKAITAGTLAGGDNIRRNAMAYQVMASYAIDNADVAKYKPSVNASFTHVSGDKNSGVGRQAGPPSSDETFSAWDSMLEGQNGGTIYNAIFNLSNMNIVTAGATVSPLEDVSASFLWSGLWLDKEVNSTNNVLTLIRPDAASGTVTTPNTTTHKDLGNEYDVNVNYAYTEDVTLGVSLGWFVAGKTFTSDNDSTASQALAHVNVNF